jgi:uncharacterized protein (TIGR03435 family)
MHKSSLLTAFVLLLTAASAIAQPATPPPAFEVASIKPAPPVNPELVVSGQAHLGVTIDNALADFGGQSLTNLIARAYRVKPYQISGPEWLSTERFDIVAKLPEGASEDSVPEMLQTLLAERFKLKPHTENKELSIYALVVDKGGPKLTPRPADWHSVPKDSVFPLSMEFYAGSLSNALDRPVVDFTRLQGEYLLSLESLARAQLARARASIGRRITRVDGSAPADADSDSPESQVSQILKPLGLKLEARKQSMPILAIDHIEKTPTEN